MADSRYRKITLILSLAGVLFSEYLSAVKLFTSTCALSEPCPYFLGYPACWYGFGMFLTLFMAALFGFSKNVTFRNVVRTHAIVSGLGILFAGYFTIPEIGRLFSGTSTYSLGLPTCAYGLIFYITIFILSFRYLRINKTILP